MFLHMETTNQQQKSLNHENESLTQVEELYLEGPKQVTQICRVKMNQSFFESCGLRRKMDQNWISVLNPNLLISNYQKLLKKSANSGARTLDLRFTNPRNTDKRQTSKF
jgi:hypothetical protein